jgi:peptide/nickel transport system substrate-binding protein
MRSGAATRTTVGSGPTAVAYGAGAVWVTNSLDGTVSRVDARREVVRAVTTVGVAPNGIAIDADGVWVTDEVAGTLVHLDRTTAGPPTATMLGGRPEGLTLADGSLWIAVQATGAVHRGGTLTVLAQPSVFGNGVDPARDYGGAWALTSAVYDGLVGFKRVGGTDGNTLVPDLASALPAPTDNGTTYTFRLREGITFADGTPLKASAVRSSFERLFRANARRRDLYEGIIGGLECRQQPRRCTLSKGIVTDDDTGTVVIKLRTADDEFLYKLAMPFASVVPSETPAFPERPALGTGPYQIAEYKPNRRLRLVRNPHFKVWSKAAQPDGVPDQIVLEVSGTPEGQLTAVQRGRADVVQELPQARFEEARVRYAAQLRVTPAARTFSLVLNTKRPPFNDVRVRRAVALAVDRGSVVDRLGANLAAPTCQLLPPNFPAYQQYCPHTLHPTKGGGWTARDLARARRLVAASGTKRMRVDVLGTTEIGELSALTSVLVKTLRELGYRTSVRRVPAGYFDVLYNGAATIEAAVHGWFPDYPSPANYISGVLQCAEAPLYSCGPAVQRTLAIQARNRPPADAAWSRLDRELVDRAIVVPVITGKAVDFVSKRVGNYQRHPLYGMLMSQAWVL